MRVGRLFGGLSGCSFILLMISLFDLAVEESVGKKKPIVIAPGQEVSCEKEGSVVRLDALINDTWQPECFECKCQNHQVVCSQNLCQHLLSCPLTEPLKPNECCPSCLFCNYLGITYQNNDKWKNPQDACSMMTCKAGIMTTSKMECVSNCVDSVVLPGYCCRLCPLVKKTLKEQSKDPCLVCETVQGLYQHCYRFACPVLDCPNFMHKEIPGRCCPECDLTKNNTDYRLTISGNVPYKIRKTPPPDKCSFRGQFYGLDSDFRVDSCTLCSCKQGGVFCKRLACSSRSCNGVKTGSKDGLCCPFCTPTVSTTTAARIRQSDCTQRLENGTLLIKHSGTRWNIDDCTICECRDGKASCRTQRCHDLPTYCSRGYKKVKLPGQCCSTCRPDEATCTIFGDPHYETFDRRRYEFKKACSYILAQECSLRGQKPNFQIIAHNDGNQTQTWTRCLTVILFEQKIFLTGKTDVFIEGLGNVSLPYSSRSYPNFELSMDSTANLLFSVHAMGIKLLWDGQSLLEITLGSQHRSRVCGLCGNFNGDPKDDFLPKYGDVLMNDTRSFVKSWRTEEKCAYRPIKDLLTCKDRKTTRLKENELKACNILKTHQFLKSCHRHIRVRNFIRKCKKAVCSCQKSSSDPLPCHCDVLNQYARRCAKKFLQVPLFPLAFITIDDRCPSIMLSEL